jgi:hypothetical protein
MLECDEASKFIGECGLSGPVDGVADRSIWRRHDKAIGQLGK